MGILLAAATVVFSLTNSFATLDFDGRGRIVSLREHETGRELVDSAVDFAVARLDNGKTVVPSSFAALRDGSLIWTFPGKAGKLHCAVSAFDGGWTFSNVGFSGRGVKRLDWMRIKPLPRRWIGRLSHLWSDENSGVAVRAYDIKVQMPNSKDILHVSISSDDGFTQWRTGLCAGPRKNIRDMLKGMTLAAGVPFSSAGGAWSLDSQDVRESCLMTYLKGDSTDAWIDLALRGGFGLVHLEGWWKHLGQAKISDYFFPGGISELKKTAADIRNAGLKVGMHTLTGCVSPYSDWMKSEYVKDLQSIRSYTLAEDLAPDAAEITVEERPLDDHDVVFTYLGRGNVLRIGREIVQYTGVRREKPYAFTGVTRGAFNTAKTQSVIRGGAKVDYLRQRYLAFYPEPDSPLADKVADELASVFNDCGMDELYLDGAEGMGSRYAVNTMRAKIFSRLQARGGIVNETSSTDPWHWWFYSRTGAWDYSLWAPKAFHDAHIRKIKDSREAELLGCQTGWWRIREADVQARGHFLDESEYYACKNAANDAPMSISSLNVNRPVVALPFQLERHLTVIGWWERFRRACVFPEPVRRRLAVPGEDFRLRQDGSGRWAVGRVKMFSHRTECRHDNVWKLSVADSTPAELRIEALYGVEPYDSAKGTAVFGDEHLAAAGKTSAGGVSVAAVCGEDRERGRTVKLSAVNGNASSKCAWGCVTRKIPAPYAVTERAIGFWVKGDGSGALLNVQLAVPREYTPAFAENYVKLDFKGWRYVERPLRERDAEEFFRYDWPYGGDIYTICRYGYKTNRLSSVSIYLNGIPAGGGAEVEISEVRSLPLSTNRLERMIVDVGGKRMPVPFSLASGEYAEFADDVWIKYSEKGNPLTRIATDGLSLAAGENEVAFSAREAGGRAARAQVTVSAVEKPFFVWDGPGASGASGMLAEEAIEPVRYAPSDGFVFMPALKVRPGETAKLKVVLVGPVKDPVLTVGDGESARKIALPSVAAGERRVFLPEGAFSGVSAMAFWSSDPKSADARVCISKLYGENTK